METKTREEGDTARNRSGGIFVAYKNRSAIPVRPIIYPPLTPNWRVSCIYLPTKYIIICAMREYIYNLYGDKQPEGVNDCVVAYIHMYIIFTMCSEIRDWGIHWNLSIDERQPVLLYFVIYKLYTYLYSTLDSMAQLWRQ